MTWKDKLELGLKKTHRFARTTCHRVRSGVRNSQRELVGRLRFRSRMRSRPKHRQRAVSPKHRARVARLVARGRYSRDTRAVLERVRLMWPMRRASGGVRSQRGV